MEEEFHKRFETIENEFYSKGLNKLKVIYHLFSISFIE